MSRGFLIHAFNNSELDYGTMALSTALLIKKHLKNNNVALITDTGTMLWMEKQHGVKLINSAFDYFNITDNVPISSNRRFHDTRYSSKVVPYHNSTRADSYDYSPWDETILVDADYLVLDSELDHVWGNTEHILANRVVKNLRHDVGITGFDARFNSMSIPLYWATLVYFKKTDRVRSIFDLIKFIKEPENYVYYQKLYKFQPSQYFRNDYALSIALHIISGQIENDGIKNFPTPEILISSEFDNFINFKNGKAYFISEDTKGDFLLHKVMSNVHVLNKWSLGRMSGKIIEYASK
jgi:hypothetical protein